MPSLGIFRCIAMYGKNSDFLDGDFRHTIGGLAYIDWSRSWAVGWCLFLNSHDFMGSVRIQSCSWHLNGLRLGCIPGFLSNTWWSCCCCFGRAVWAGQRLWKCSRAYGVSGVLRCCVGRAPVWAGQHAVEVLESLRGDVGHKEVLRRRHITGRTTLHARWGSPVGSRCLLMAGRQRIGWRRRHLTDQTTFRHDFWTRIFRRSRFRRRHLTGLNWNLLADSPRFPNFLVLELWDGLWQRSITGHTPHGSMIEHRATAYHRPFALSVCLFRWSVGDGVSPAFWLCHLFCFCSFFLSRNGLGTMVRPEFLKLSLPLFFFAFLDGYSFSLLRFFPWGFL
ncbi:uncharacterized protein LOC131001242 [Salvia miltiorrhiza]|uniref:uncharacterized protein LOC131001242 n=1 Tax=Salvia miltiorrhiza TaxID=226208 RepID=UPI0025AC8CF3|nr:uncharacterized protein LOC131001242 [Salvia miltiorrhiza]